MWQNVNNEVLSALFKYQAKIPNRSGIWVQGVWQKYTPPSPLLSKDEGLKNIGHSMSIKNLIFGANRVTTSDLIRCDSLLQNPTDVITKCDSYFITKRDRSLLQNAPGFLLQNETKVYYKMRQVFYYKMRQLLQNAAIITKCGFYYKWR